MYEETHDVNTDITNKSNIHSQPAINNRDTTARCEICSKLTIKTPERPYWRHFVVFIVNFERIAHLVLVFLLLRVTSAT